MMKFIFLSLLTISFIGTGASGFFFTKIKKAIDEKSEIINTLTNDNQVLERAIIFEKKKFSDVQISLSETEAILVATKRNSARIASSLSSLKERSTDLSKKLKVSESINKDFKKQFVQLKNSIFDLNSQEDASQKKIGELGQDIKRLRVENQSYQTKIQKLETNIVVSTEPEPKDLNNDFSVRFLEINPSTGLVAIDLRKSSKVKNGTKIILKKMGFTIGRLKIIEIGENYAVGNVEPGINRFSSYNTGDNAEVILPTEKNQI